MLILQGLLRAAVTMPERTDKKTGEVIPMRELLQIETTDERGLVQLETITVPDLKPYAEKLNQKVNIPVRAWAPSATVRFVYADQK